MLFEQLLVGQGGALLVGFLVTFLVAGNTKRLWCRRNLSVVGLLALSPLFLGIVQWGRRMDGDQGFRLAGWIFTGVYAVLGLVVLWSLVVAFRRRGSEWEPNVGRRGLLALLLVLVAFDAAAALGRNPDDCGYYTNLGARRWVETGTLPYGDAKLRGPEAPGFGAAATYGPLLYAANLPAQLALGVEANPADADPMDPAYVEPPVLTSQLTCLGFQLLALLALVLVGKRLASTETGLALAVLYAGSPYVLGLGGDELVIGGMAFVSHIAPAAVVLLALLAAERPTLAGILLALAAGVLFYPAFFFPLWLGWYLWNRKGALRFGLGFALTGAALVALVWFGTHAADGENPLRLFLQSTLEHQEGVGAKEYGGSRFSFWGTHPEWAAYWQEPVWGETSLLKRTFLGFAGLCALSFFLARGRDVARLAALTAMLGAAVQLWKTHATGSYVEWWYPLLLVGLFARPAKDGAAREPAREEPPARPDEVDEWAAEEGGVPFPVEL